LPVSVDITLQGAADQQPHRVSVAFNGASIGEIDFANLSNVTNTFPITSSLLQDGTNTVTLTALEGDNDISLVQSIALHYPHLYAADSTWLRATANAGEALHLTGFTNPQIHVFDITDPLAITQLNGSVKLENGAYSVSLALQNAAPATRAILAFSDDQ